jgi:hypothetical protein
MFPLTCLVVLQNLDVETKKNALDESKLCTFCLKHAAGSECYDRGLVSKPACQIPECERQHSERLHKMMASLNASVNTVEYCEGNREGWRTPDDSWLEMEAMEEEEAGRCFTLMPS